MGLVPEIGVLFSGSLGDPPLQNKPGLQPLPASSIPPPMHLQLALGNARSMNWKNVNIFKQGRNFTP